MPDAGTTETKTEKPTPALKLNFLSHGTLDCRDLGFTRKFYEEFLGLEVVQTSAISMFIRLGGPHVIAVVKAKSARWGCSTTTVSMSRRRKRSTKRIASSPSKPRNGT
jgi:catechol-2,3-dioxygenase